MTGAPPPVRPRVVAGGYHPPPVPTRLPDGAGRCPDCGGIAWLPAGPITAVCDACTAIAARLAAAACAVAPALAADPAEVALRGELDPPED